MLYDNAQLASAYLHAFQVTGDTRYLDVSRATLDYVLRDLTTADGLWAASQDADTDGHEGLTYVWTPDEIAAVVGPDDAALVAEAYGVTPEGNFEGRTILSRVRGDEEIGRFRGLEPEEVGSRLARARAMLLEARARRPQPARDDKAIAAWNGLMLAAFADAAVVLSSLPAAAAGVDRGERYRAAAVRAGEALLTLLQGPDGRMARSWKDGRTSGQGVLEDQAHVAAGLFALYEATWDERWFVAARRIMDATLEHFADPAGGFFDTADDHEPLPARPKELQDNALPSGNAMAATVLLALAALTGEGRYRDAAERLAGPRRPGTRRATRPASRSGSWRSTSRSRPCSRSRSSAIRRTRTRPRSWNRCERGSGRTRWSRSHATRRRSAIPLLRDRPMLGRAPDRLRVPRVRLPASDDRPGRARPTAVRRGGGVAATSGAARPARPGRPAGLAARCGSGRARARRSSCRRSAPRPPRGPA